MNTVFVGVEAEGRLKGVPTLFSQGVSPDLLQLADNEGVNHILVGGKGHTLTDGDYVQLRALLDISFGAYIFTVHASLTEAHRIPAAVWGSCHIMLYHWLEEAHLLKGDVTVKLENGNVAAVYGSPQILDLHYTYDREVDRG